jgi:4-amino-4-deoxy-L-arabinose transferase-like glycosyltransferase
VLRSHWLSHPLARLDRRPILVLSVITLIAAAIRFFRLASPCLWADEAEVYWRTCGTFGQLLQCLQIDGFSPLHYEMHWSITHLQQASWVPWTWALVGAVIGFFGLVATSVFRKQLGRTGQIGPWFFSGLIALCLIWQFWLIHCFLTWVDGWGDRGGIFHRSLHSLVRYSPDPPLPSVHWLWIGWATPRIKPTPFVLRFVPALCGTLTVPAIYLLARELVDRTTSLLAAAITACSAFLIFYSRDAKMYAEAWLMVTLTIACMLWWFRNPTWTAWLCWVAAGCAAVGVQMTSAIAIGVSLLLLLTQSKMHWRRGLAWVAGVAVVMSGPAVYFGIFNQFTERASDNYQSDSGLAWVDMYNFGRGGPELARFAATTWAIGWEWPGDRQIAAIPPRAFKTPRACAVGVAIVLAAGLIPWPRRWRAVEGPRLRPRWRALLWVLLWIALPTYGFYCYSVEGFATPLDWFNSALARMHFWSYPWLWSILGGAAAIAAAVTAVRSNFTRSATVRGLVTVTVIVTVLLLMEAMGQTMRPMAKAAKAADHPWHSLWVPRYMASVYPAVIVAMATMVMRLPTIYLRALATVGLLSINLAIGAVRIFGQTEPPTDRLAADEFAAVTSDHRLIAWFVNPAGGKGPGEGNLDSEPGRYYFQLLADKPMSPDSFRASLNHVRVEQGWPNSALPRDVFRNPNVKKIIVWDQYRFGQTVPDEALLPRLPGWTRRGGDEWFNIHDFWTGAEHYRMRRREYGRD